MNYFCAEAFLYCPHKLGQFSSHLDFSAFVQWNSLCVHELWRNGNGCAILFMKNKKFSKWVPQFGVLIRYRI